MASDRPEPDSTEPSEGLTTPEASYAGPPDPSTLVHRFVESGEWPDPALCEQLVAAGEGAVGPLLDFMRTYPDTKDPREAALYHGIGILGAIRSPAAMPTLIEILKRYPDDTGEEAARVIGEFGAAAFEPALDLVRDPQMKGYPLRHAIEAAKDAAVADPALRSRLAEALRPMLADAMDRTREADRLAEMEAEEEGEEETGGWTVVDLEESDLSEGEDEFEGGEPGETPDEDASETDAVPPEVEPYEEVMFLVGDLADLADSQARTLIKQAFAEKLVDEFWIDEKFVDDQYRRGAEAPQPPLDWLEDYRERYEQHIEDMNRPEPPRRPSYQPSRPMAYSESTDRPAPVSQQETIRNIGPKLGRNDPCWCGSGKKYKKCHLGKDERA